MGVENDAGLRRKRKHDGIWKVRFDTVHSISTAPQGGAALAAAPIEWCRVPLEGSFSSPSAPFLALSFRAARHASRPPRRARFRQGERLNGPVWLHGCGDLFCAGRVLQAHAPFRSQPKLSASFRSLFAGDFDRLKLAGITRRGPWNRAKRPRERRDLRVPPLGSSHVRL